MCMVLQTAIDYDIYYRCFCVDRRYIRILEYDPNANFMSKFIKNPRPLGQRLKRKLQRSCIKLCRALGYEINSVEFAVKKGDAFAIDFMNPVPNFSCKRLHVSDFEWVLEKINNLIIRKAFSKHSSISFHHWHSP